MVAPFRSTFGLVATSFSYESNLSAGVAATALLMRLAPDCSWWAGARYASLSHPTCPLQAGWDGWDKRSPGPPLQLFRGRIVRKQAVEAPGLGMPPPHRFVKLCLSII